MKRTLIAGGLFLLSYVAVNRGLGPHPFQVVPPLIVVVGVVGALSWRARRRAVHRAAAEPAVPLDLAAHPQPQPRPRTGGKARKLF